MIDPATGKVIAGARREFPYGQTFFGFGCAITSRVYKLVRLRKGSTCWECDVFTLGDGIGWRRSEKLGALVR